MKRFVCVLAVLLAFACLLSVGTLAYDVEYAEGDYTYTVVEVSVGETSFYYEAAMITGYTGSGDDVTIPDTLGGYSVTSIGDDAFYNCSSLTSVTIPDSVTSIGRDAFYNCSSLISIAVADKNTAYTSQDGVLYNQAMTKLVCCPGGITGGVTIPDGVTSIGDYAFCGCSSLTSVTIPDGVTSIGDYAFCGCSSLTSVTIPDSVTSIGERAFGGCSGLTSINIPDSVTSIRWAAFYSCSGLTSVTIPDGVTSIENWAFSDCSGLTSVMIPDSVTSIRYGAFSGCSGLTDVYYGGTAAQWSGISIDDENENLTEATIHFTESGAWKSNSTGWWYDNGDGTYPANEWKQIDGVWYYFKRDGYMAANEWCSGYWLNANGAWTYPYKGSWKHNATGWWYEDSSGWYPQNTWQKIDGVWYFFKPDGYMAASEWYGGYWLNADGSWTYQPKGSWKQNDVGWWFGDTSGWYANNETLKINDVLYTFNAAGYWKK